MMMRNNPQSGLLFHSYSDSPIYCVASVIRTPSRALLYLNMRELCCDIRKFPSSILSSIIHSVPAIVCPCYQYSPGNLTWCRWNVPPPPPRPWHDDKARNVLPPFNSRIPQLVRLPLSLGREWLCRSTMTSGSREGWDRIGMQSKLCLKPAPNHNLQFTIIMEYCLWGACDDFWSSPWQTKLNIPRRRGWSTGNLRDSDKTSRNWNPNRLMMELFPLVIACL